MSWTTVRPFATAVILSAIVAACGALDVSDPTAIGDDDLNNAASADLLRADAIGKLNGAMVEAAVGSGLLADEFFADTDPLFQQAGLINSEELLDRRNSLASEQKMASSYAGSYLRWQEVRYAAGLAMERLRAYSPDGVARAYVGQMFALQAFAALHLAEDFCPGLPLHRVVNYQPVYGSPLSTDEVFKYALADFDSALVYAADSARFLHLARIGRARALVGLARFAEAGAAVAGVPTEYVYNAEHGSGFNWLGQFDASLDKSVANQEGGVGLDFAAAGDPRVQVLPVGTAYDGATTLYSPAKYPDSHAPIVLASGREARLIESEAALAGGGAWLDILNQLRGEVPGLSPLADPGSEAGRVDLLFRERAFWLFGTAHRLGDLRRLLSRYGRPVDGVFPNGAYRLGGSYDIGTSIPFPAALETPYNPAVTGCTAR